MSTGIAHHHHMAMVHAVEKLAPNPRISLVAALATHFDHPALSVRADWPALLECSEQDILDALAEYTYTQIDCLRRGMARSETGISQQMAVAAAGFRDSDQARELAEKWAAQAWAFYRMA